MSGPLLDAFGWGESDKRDENYQAIMSRLTEIQGQVSAVQDGIRKVQNAITDVQTAIDDTETQAIMRSFRAPASQIDEKFATYCEALDGLVSGAPDLVEQAAHILSDPAGEPDPHEISQMLSQAQDIFLPRHAGMTGLLEAQSQVIKSAIMTQAQPDPLKWVGMDDKFEAPQYQMDGGPWSGESIYHKGKDIGEQVLGGQIAQTFRWVMTTQLKGLILLQTAWHGSIHASRVTAHAARMRDTLDEIVTFLDNVAKPTIDASVAAAMKANGTRMAQPYTKGGYPWLTWPPGTHIDCPFDDDDIIWKSLPTGADSGALASPVGSDASDILVMIRTPWAPQSGSLFGLCAIRTVEKCQLDTKHFSLSFETPGPSEVMPAPEAVMYNATIEPYDRNLPQTLQFVPKLVRSGLVRIMTHAEIEDWLDTEERRIIAEGGKKLSPEKRASLIRNISRYHS